MAVVLSTVVVAISPSNGIDKNAKVTRCCFLFVSNDKRLSSSNRSSNISQLRSIVHKKICVHIYEIGFRLITTENLQVDLTRLVKHSSFLYMIF
jgi:hypothetical protein